MRWQSGEGRCRCRFAPREEDSRRQFTKEPAHTAAPHAFASLPCALRSTAHAQVGAWPGLAFNAGPPHAQHLLVRVVLHRVPQLRHSQPAAFAWRRVRGLARPGSRSCARGALVKFKCVGPAASGGEKMSDLGDSPLAPTWRAPGSVATAGLAYSGHGRARGPGQLPGAGWTRERRMGRRLRPGTRPGPG